MSNHKESLYEALVSRFTDRDLLCPPDENLTQQERDFNFTMRCNGLFRMVSRAWENSTYAVQPLVDSFKGQRVAMFGPGAISGHPFFSGVNKDPEVMSHVLGQPSVINAIGKYRSIDEDQAARIAFILGGLVRYQRSKIPHVREEVIEEAVAGQVEFVAKKIMLGEGKSGEAIASAMAKYVISEGSLEEDKGFTGQVYHMTDAIKEDPVVTLETKDLGLSQVARIRGYLSKIRGEKSLPFSEVAEGLAEDLAAWQEFPTVGAEFHLQKADKDLLQRLAVTNMSQFQGGSYIQFSGNDRGVIEIRMNPSSYPVTVANWNYLRQILPEIKKAFFWVTINRKSCRDFFWDNGDEGLLNNLRALGMLSYVNEFDSVPIKEKPDEVNFGNVYLGQTVRLVDGRYTFSGCWNGDNGEERGQLSVYAGFGENLPELAYYLSMTLANVGILGPYRNGSLSEIKTLRDALAQKPDRRKNIFDTIRERIGRDSGLSRADKAGNIIIEELSPKRP